MDMFTVPFHQTFLEELTRVLIKLFIKIEKKWNTTKIISLKYSLEAKPDKKHNGTKQNCGLLPLTNTDTNILFLTFDFYLFFSHIIQPGCSIRSFYYSQPILPPFFFLLCFPSEMSSPTKGYVLNSA